MTKKHGACLRLYFDEFNASGYASKFSRKIKVDTSDVSNFGSAGSKEYLEGMRDWTGDWTGFFDNTAAGWDYETFARLQNGSDHYVGQVLAATVAASAAAGDTCWEDVVHWTDQPREFDIGGSIALSGSLQGTGGTSQGTVLFAGAVTEDGNQTGINCGASAAASTTVVTYRVLAVSGAGTIALTIEQSQDDGSGDAYAAINDLASGNLTAVGTTRKTYTGATEAWKRLVVDITDFTSVTLLVTITTLK